MGLKAFLRPLYVVWCGIKAYSCANIKWKKVCVGNKVSMLRHLWALSKKSDSLWVKLVLTNIIKSSSTIRKLFNLRVLGQPLISYIIGDGVVYILVDGRHLHKWPFGERVVYNLGRSLGAKYLILEHEFLYEVIGLLKKLLLTSWQSSGQIDEL